MFNVLPSRGCCVKVAGAGEVAAPSHSRDLVDASEPPEVKLDGAARLEWGNPLWFPITWRYSGPLSLRTMVSNHLAPLALGAIRGPESPARARPRTFPREILGPE